MSGEDVSTNKYPLVEQATEALDGWLAFYIINAATPMLKKAPQWQRIILFFLYFEFILAIVWRLAGDETIALIQATIAVISTAFAAHITHVIAKSMIGVLHTKIAPNLSPAISGRAGRMVKKRFSLRKQLLVSIPVAFIVASFSFLGFSPFTSISNPLLLTLWGLGIVAYLNLFSFLLFLWSISSLPAIFVESQVELYPLDPRQSPLVQGSLTIADRIVWLLVIAMVIYLGESAVFIISVDPSDQSVLLVLLIPFALIVVGIVALFFFQQQLNLSALVDARRSRTLFELQEKLSALYARSDNLSKDELARQDNLIALHDRVTQTGERAFDLVGTLRFFFPVLLPLLSSLLGALPFREEIIAFIKSILQALLDN